MKILLHTAPFLTELAKHFSVIHNVVSWSHEVKPALDLFYEFKPDIFVPQISSLNRATLKAIAKYTPQLVVYADVLPNVANRQILKNLGQAHLFASNQKIADAWGCTCLPPAANILEYGNAKVDESLMCEIAIATGFQEGMQEYVWPLVKKYNIKIFGDKPWPAIPEYLGNVDAPTTANLYCSAKITLLFSREVSDQVFNVTVANGPPVVCNGDYGEFNKYVMSANSVDEIIQRVEKRDTFIAIPIRGENTYFDRAADIFDMLALDAEATAFRKTSEEYK